MLLNEIIGQEIAKKHLTDMVKNNRLSHANLLVGSEGNGLLPLAIAFAQYLVSLPSSSTKADDLFGSFSEITTENTFIEPSEIVHLPAYIKAKNLIHPDLHFSFPTITKKAGDTPSSKDFIVEWRNFISQFPYGTLFDWLQFINAENKQGKITSQECNEIVKTLSLKSFESEYKVLLMWLPETIGKEGNKLLKLIEEPPNNTILLLVTENEDKVLPTIVSRCRVIKTNLLSVKEIQEALIERCQIEPDKALEIANRSNGSYREALSLLQHDEDDMLPVLRDWLNNILKGSNLAKLSMAEQLNEMGREKQKQFLQYFIHLLACSIKVQILGSNVREMSRTEFEFAEKINKVATINDIQQLTIELTNAIYYVERNANGKMLFMALSIKIYYLLKYKQSIHIA